MVNRDDMIAYLLHQMPEAERAAFAERWFTEPDLYEQLQMVEAELLDDCARGKVSRSQRRQIEQYLLGSEFQQRKLAFAGALQAAIPSPKSSRVAWLPLIAAVLIASLGLSLWLGIENRKLQNEATRLHVPQVVADGVYTIGLPSDTLRGATENAVRLPAGVRLLRVELELPPGNPGGDYSAALLSGDRTVWREGPLRAEAGVATVWIPATVFAPGEHAIKLDASGSASAYYRFTILR
jgi:hypothetical protein